MKIKLLSALLFYLFYSSISATQIPQEVKKCVAFIFTGEKADSLKPYGTGFFVSIQDSIDSVIYGYFVTAKHVLKDKNNNYFENIFIRLNKKNGSSDTIAVPLFNKGKPKFVVDIDPTVDIAIIPAFPDTKIYDYLFIPHNMITTKEMFIKENIREGDDVFFTGLFTPHYGREYNLPIVRFGKVALISEEKVFWDSLLTDLYLIETTSFGGNSGSPLFFYLSGDRIPGVISPGGKLLLAGIVKGYFGESTRPGLVETKSKFVWPFENSGIAAIVPAYKLYDLLFSDRLKKLREK